MGYLYFIEDFLGARIEQPYYFVKTRLQAIYYFNTFCRKNKSSLSSTQYTLYEVADVKKNGILKSTKKIYICDESDFLEVFNKYKN